MMEFFNYDFIRIVKILERKKISYKHVVIILH